MRYRVTAQRKRYYYIDLNATKGSEAIRLAKNIQTSHWSITNKSDWIEVEAVSTQTGKPDDLS